MDLRFSIQIDDDNHSLSSSHGISIKYIWELLRDLYKSIDIDQESICTLSNVRGNCYALDFTTQEPKHLERFTIVHKNIEVLPEQHLNQEEKAYARTLKKILSDKYFLKAYDNERNVIATIKELNKEKIVSTYYTTKIIYGVLSELGGKSISSENKHIRIDGFPYNIGISKDMDLLLKQYYGTNKLMIKIRVKMSVEHNRIIDAELTDFDVISKSTLSENLKEVGYVDFEMIKGARNINDIIDRLYGNTD